MYALWECSPLHYVYSNEKIGLELCRVFRNTTLHKMWHCIPGKCPGIQKVQKWTMNKYIPHPNSLLLWMGTDLLLNSWQSFASIFTTRTSGTLPMWLPNSLMSTSENHTFTHCFKNWSLTAQLQFYHFSTDVLQYDPA
jgi:hypothetical protein